MTIFKYSPTYLLERKKFLKHNSHLFQKTVKALSLLSLNPRHPSLHLEKLSGSEIWTVRIDRGNRLFFSFLDDKTILLLDIVKHD